MKQRKKKIHFLENFREKGYSSSYLSSSFLFFFSSLLFLLPSSFLLFFSSLSSLSLPLPLLSSAAHALYSEMNLSISIYRVCADGGWRGGAHPRFSFLGWCVRKGFGVRIPALSSLKFIGSFHLEKSLLGFDQFLQIKVSSLSFNLCCKTSKIYNSTPQQLLFHMKNISRIKALCHRIDVPI